MKSQTQRMSGPQGCTLPLEDKALLKVVFLLHCERRVFITSNLLTTEVQWTVKAMKSTVIQYINQHIRTAHYDRCTSENHFKKLHCFPGCCSLELYKNIFYKQWSKVNWIVSFLHPDQFNLVNTLSPVSANFF